MNKAARAGGRPVFVWAPVARCGTGLLQRLITSSKQVLMFGEDRYLARTLPQFLIAYANTQAESKQACAKLAVGDYTGWVPGALPEDYSTLLVKHFLSACQMYQFNARRYGFARWGTKLPEFNVHEFKLLKKLLPDARHVFLYRHILPAMRSMKARKWIHSLADIEKFAVQYAQTMLNVHNNLRWEPGFLCVGYEQLMVDKAGQSRRLADHLGLETVDQAVFEHKVNTHRGSPEKGHAPDEYIPPEDLDTREADLTSKICQVALEAWGYEAGAHEGLDAPRSISATP